MLEKQLFLKGINYLKANYLSWQFDINNDLMISVWYKKFANLESNVFMGMIEKYTEVNKFGPQSPADLLECLRNEITNQELDANAAWGEVIKLIRTYGFNYNTEKIYQELENKPALKKTVEQFESNLRNLEVGDTYTPERFKQAYNINLQRQTFTKSCVLLGSKAMFLIE